MMVCGLNPFPTVTPFEKFFFLKGCEAKHDNILSHPPAQ
jgi:hypothetical protein